MHVVRKRGQGGEYVDEFGVFAVSVFLHLVRSNIWSSNAHVLGVLNWQKVSNHPTSLRAVGQELKRIDRVAVPWLAEGAASGSGNSPASRAQTWARHTARSALGLAGRMAVAGVCTGFHVIGALPLAELCLYGRADSADEKYILASIMHKIHLCIAGKLYVQTCVCMSVRTHICIFFSRPPGLPNLVHPRPTHPSSWGGGLLSQKEASCYTYTNILQDLHSPYMIHTTWRPWAGGRASRGPRRRAAGRLGWAGSRRCNRAGPRAG